MGDADDASEARQHEPDEQERGSHEGHHRKVLRTPPRHQAVRNRQQEARQHIENRQNDLHLSPRFLELVMCDFGQAIVAQPTATRLAYYTIKVNNRQPCRLLREFRMKKFLLPLQNMVRADLFSGSLAVWSARGGAAHFCPATPEPRSAQRGGQLAFANSFLAEREGFEPSVRLYNRTAV